MKKRDFICITIILVLLLIIIYILSQNYAIEVNGINYKQSIFDYIIGKN